MYLAVFSRHTLQRGFDCREGQQFSGESISGTAPYFAYHSYTLGRDGVSLQDGLARLLWEVVLGSVMFQE